MIIRLQSNQGEIDKAIACSVTCHKRTIKRDLVALADQNSVGCEESSVLIVKWLGVRKINICSLLCNVTYNF